MWSDGGMKDSHRTSPTIILIGSVTLAHGIVSSVPCTGINTTLSHRNSFPGMTGFPFFMIATADGSATLPGSVNWR